MHGRDRVLAILIEGEPESSLIVAGGQTINAFDIYTGELIAEKAAASSVNEVLVAGSTGYCFFGEADGQLEIYNLTKGTSRYGSTYEMKVHISQMGIRNGVVTIRSLPDTQLYPVFVDDSHFACVQNEGTIYFMDLESGNVTELCAMEGAGNLDVAFSADNSKVFLSEDSGDYRLAVVDIRRYEECNTIALDVYGNLYILNAKDYGLMEVVENGMPYMPKHSTGYAAYYSEVYRFPYMTLEMLLADAKEQYPNEALSELEKIQYNID